MIYFSKESLEFLKNVREKNSKEWFAEHKELYKDCIIEPLQELVLQLSDAMYKIDNEFELFPKKVISRINRDTRFSKDKSLYKDKMWLTFKKSGADNIDYPAFFLEITPDFFRYGMGFFQASPSTMNEVRTRIDNKSGEFFRIITKINEDGTFIPEGEMYKKNKYFGEIQQIETWYNRKNIYLVHNETDIKQLFSNSVAERLKKDYQLLLEIYNFFTTALSNDKS